MKSILSIPFLGMTTLFVVTIPAAMPVLAQSTSSAQTKNHPDLDTRIRTDKTQYDPDQAVEIKMSVANLGKQNLRLTPPRRTGGYKLTITHARTGNFIALIEAKMTRNTEMPVLKPEDTLRFSELWDQRDSRGNVVPSGVYNIEVNLYNQTAKTQVYLAEGKGNPNGNNGDNGQTVYVPVPVPTHPHNNGIGIVPPFSPGGIPISTTVILPGAPINLFSVSLTSDRMKVRPGDRVRLTYRLVNNGPSLCSYNFGSGQQCDFEIAPQRSKKLTWRQSDEMRYAQALTSLSVRAGESQTYTAYWNVPKKCDSGTYKISAYLTPRGGHQAEMATCSIEVD
jgi:Intracellular proteinase inhibitor